MADQGKKVVVFICITGAILGAIVLADRLFNHAKLTKNLPILSDDKQVINIEEKGGFAVVDNDLLPEQPAMPVKVVQEPCDEHCLFPDSFVQEFGYGPNNCYGTRMI